MDTKNENNEQNEQPKKCFCARCFLPIEAGDKVNIDGQNFHRMCSSCYAADILNQVFECMGWLTNDYFNYNYMNCPWQDSFLGQCPWLWRKQIIESICHQIPKTVKMFYGHVFCDECFKTHVLNRFKGEPQTMHSASWWMQFAPGMKPQGPAQDSDPPKEDEENQKEKEDEKEKEKRKDSAATKCSEEPPKRCICARCLQPVDEKIKVDIGGQCFHPLCARCYFCHCIPKDNVKIYYGQVFCEECFNRFVMARNKETPAEHFRSCFEHMQNNSQFAEGMKEFMAGSAPMGKEGSPIIFMMQGAHPPYCRCGNHSQAHEWLQANEPRKSAVSSVGDDSFGTWDLSFENRTEVSDLQETRSRESANPNLIVTAAEKIEKLTKYVQDNFDSEKATKKWKNFIEYDKFSMVSEKEPSDFPWINLQDPNVEKAKTCPQCLWQCGPIFVTSDYFQKEVLLCGDNFE